MLKNNFSKETINTYPLVKFNQKSINNQYYQLNKYEISFH